MSRDNLSAARVPQPTDQLEGSLGVWSIVFMVIAGAAPLTVVGAVMPVAFVVGNGAGLPVAFIVAAVVLLLFSVGYAAMTPYASKTGAFYLYVRQGLGVYAGAGTGYAALLSYALLYGGIYAILGNAIRNLVINFAGPDLPWWIWGGVALAIVLTLGHFNIDLSGRILSVLLVAEVGVVVVLDAVIVFNGGGDEGMSTGFLDLGITLGGSFGLALLFAILSFIGFEATAIFREETRDPKRTIPRATYISVIFVGVFYAVTSWILASAIGDDAVGSLSPEAQGSMLSDLATVYLGRIGRDIVAVLLVTSMFACALLFHGVVSRYIYSLSRDRLLPRRLMRVHPKHKSPYIASVVAAVVVAIQLIVCVALGLEPITQFYTWFSGLASIGYVSLLLITQIASIAFLRRHLAEVGRARGQVIPIISVVTLIGVLVIVVANAALLLGSEIAAWTSMIALAFAYVLGPVIVFIQRKRSIDGGDEPRPENRGESVGSDHR
jgi:amino acid transporter